MPRTSTGHHYKVREREDGAACVVCSTAESFSPIEMVMRLQFTDWSGTYAFPVCSVGCMIGWSELVGRVLDGDAEATIMATAFMALGRHND